MKSPARIQEGSRSKTAQKSRSLLGGTKKKGSGRQGKGGRLLVFGKTQEEIFLFTETISETNPIQQKKIKLGGEDCP